MNTELEQQAREWWLKYTGLVYAETGKITIARLEGSVVAVRDVEMLAAFAAHVLEAQSKPIHGEVITVPLSPEMVEKIMEVVDDVCSFDNWSVPQIQRLRTRLLGIR